MLNRVTAAIGANNENCEDNLINSIIEQISGFQFCEFDYWDVQGLVQTFHFILYLIVANNLQIHKWVLLRWDILAHTSELTYRRWWHSHGSVLLLLRSCGWDQIKQIYLYVRQRVLLVWDGIHAYWLHIKIILDSWRLIWFVCLLLGSVKNSGGLRLRSASLVVWLTQYFFYYTVSGYFFFQLQFQMSDFPVFLQEHTLKFVLVCNRIVAVAPCLNCWEG